MRTVIEVFVVAAIVVFAGFFGVWQQFSDRLPPRTHIGTFSLGGLRIQDVPGALAAYEQEFLSSSITVGLRGKYSTHTVADLGVKMNSKIVQQQLDTLTGRFMPLRNIVVYPAIEVDDVKTQKLLEQDFSTVLQLPKNPTLQIRPDYVVTVLPGTAGERIDSVSLSRDIAQVVRRVPYAWVLATTVRAVPQEDPIQLETLRVYVQQLLNSGFFIAHGEERFILPKSDIATMLRFQGNSGTAVLFDEALIRSYLNKEIAPKIHTDAINARFEVQDGRVSQFAMPQDGRELDIDATMEAIQASLTAHTTSATIALTKKSPLLTDVQSTEDLGITTMLARGETDFKGSPKNRIHNIIIGTARYHGLLIAPGEEFSFNAFLGPVTAGAGFKPALVIKKNGTTLELGGGICQVSTTIFRAAVHAGMKITARKSHSYAVMYYGTPGFDATIYPPYTDFRFLNNTSGHLLIQTKIDGTRLSFELWGTPDGREVIVDGPHPYNKQSNGAVKATLKQTVTKDGKVLIEDTFTSNYKSPALFPSI